MKTGTKQTDPSDHLPLTPVAFEILLAVADGEKHGYAVLQEIEDRTGMVLYPGTLYRSLARLVTEGLLDERAAAAELAAPGGPQPTKAFRLTPLGRRVAGAEAERLERQVGAARRKRLLTSGRSGR